MTGRRPTCITCGADLQDGRCPWAMVGQPAGADGNTYCRWPRPVKRPTPSFRAPTRRK